MNILIIEDNVKLNNELTTYCKRNNNYVVSASDGLNAIDLIDEKDFCVYILDLNLPNMHGLEIIKYIRKTDLCTPIIVITHSADIETIKEAYNLGCNDYMKKPFHLDELRIRVKKVLDKKYESKIIFNDNFYYDSKEKVFYHHGTILKLRYKEKRFCDILTKNLNTYVKNSDIYDYVWEQEVKDFYPLRQLVSELRKKLPYSIIDTKLKEGYSIQTKFVS
ncbi:MAG: response regulator transcription factor [Campylobacterota bacterium]|nr:response regulator transcription factor [Campylobacterota bacterium]